MKNFKKYVYIKTFGCQMNVYDSILISEGLLEIGYELTENIETADLILFNTCAVRGLAEHKALSELGATKKLKTKKPDLQIGMLGCVAQNLGKKILKSYPFVDFVLGTKEMYKLPTYLNYKTDKARLEVSLDNKIVGYKTKKNLPNSVSVFVTIIRGCSNFCSYCIVPFVRGKEESRNIDEIFDEVKILVGNGVKEIVLLGQNVNIYGKDINIKLESLLQKLNEIDGLYRIRYFTSHPKDVNEDFIKSIKSIPKICEHIHIPFQSGSNRILKSMNRKYTREEYIEKVNMIRDYIPNIAITTDIIVGYPTETEKDFVDTLELLKVCKLDNIYSFKYSPRAGTLSYKNLEDDISKEIKEKRLEILNNLENEISRQINNSLIGTSQEVLWENLKKTKTTLDIKNNFTIEGRTRTFKKVFANTSIQNAEKSIGKLEVVEIKKATAYSLTAERK
ncbi:MAG: tRNA (N6-isopentenyl adenosine(37)-C2)-methylthiotransferase MiaB [Elusimicrobiota bacterium]|nr:tRNA (N6-isopentenyl adenosine(37)-C2)-methylthiotransferase MiaB [Elusimicrobiota bacterium]